MHGQVTLLHRATRRRGLHLVEVMVAFGLLVTLVGPFLAQMRQSRLAQKDSDQQAVARGLLDFLAADVLAHEPGSRDETSLTPASEFPGVSSFVAQAAGADLAMQVWDGLQISRSVLRQDGLIFITLRVEWPEGKRTGASELTLAVVP